MLHSRCTKETLKSNARHTGKKKDSQYDTRYVQGTLKTCKPHIMQMQDTHKEEKRLTSCPQGVQKRHLCQPQGAYKEAKKRRESHTRHAKETLKSNTRHTQGRKKAHQANESHTHKADARRTQGRKKTQQANKSHTRQIQGAHKEEKRLESRRQGMQ